MKVRRFVLMGLTWLLAVSCVMAQMSDPREQFSITAAVSGSLNSDYSWEKPSGAAVADGRMKGDVNVRLHSNVSLFKIKNLSLSLAPFYHFSNQRLDTEWGAEPLAFSLPSTHHHFGGSLLANYHLQVGGKPLTLIGMGTGNFSQYGFESAQGLFGGMFSLIRNRNTHLGVGAVYLLGTAVAWPLFPLIVYSHRFNEQWSLNCMGINNFLYYHVSPTMKYSLGMELETSKLYFRPDVEGLPRKAQISQLSERLGVFADWQATKGMAFNVGMGVTVPFYCRLQESGYRDSYMNLKARVKPFVSVKVKYSIFRNK